MCVSVGCKCTNTDLTEDDKPASSCTTTASSHLGLLHTAVNVSPTSAASGNFIITFQGHGEKLVLHHQAQSCHEISAGEPALDTAAVRA